MAPQSAPTSPARLWRRLTHEQRLHLAGAMWGDEESTSQRAEAIVHIAKQMKFRTQYVQKLPPDKLVRLLATVPGVPDGVAGRALIAFHLAEKRPMLRAFLDHLGIPHEDGLIAGHIDPPDPSKVAEAAARLSAEFPVEDVRLYLATLAAQDHETWGALDEVLASQGGSGPPNR